MTARSPRVAVTGIGIVSALGFDRETSFRRLVAGESGIGELTLFSLGTGQHSLAAEVSAARLTVSGLTREGSRSDAFAIAAAREALQHAGLEASTPMSVAVGGTTGGMLEAEELLAARPGPLPEASVKRLLSYPLSTSASRLRDELGAVERVVTVCSACSSGANALVLGAAWLAAERADVVLAGGTDALCRLTYFGFNALGLMAPEPCRPFDRRRAGLSLGEGAAFLVLESEAHARARGAEVVAWLSGSSVASEAFHITHPEPSAATSVRLMRDALARAGLCSDDVDYVNAHGTGTPQNDATEARALAEVFGARIGELPVSSSKGQVGHTLGAAGAMEAAFSALSCARSVVPPTGGLVDPDPSLTLRHVIGRGEARPVRVALSSSFGFGGAGSVLVFERADAELRYGAATRARIAVSAVVVDGPGGERTGGGAAEHLADAPIAPTPRADPLSALDPTRSRRFDRASAWVTLGVVRALDDAKLEPGGVGLVAGSAFGNVDRSVQFLRRAFERGPRFASPAEFPHLVPSAAAGNASIYLGLTGPVVTVSEVSAACESALEVGATFLDAGLASAIVVGAVEPSDEVIERVLGPLHGLGDGGAERGEAGAWLLLETEDAMRARGGRALAWVRHAVERTEAAALPEPSDVTRALAVSFGRAAEIGEWLDGSAWSGVETRALEVARIPAEARGGVALAAAVAVVASGARDDALVLNGTGARRRAIWISRAAGDRRP